ncbi:MAG TPA: hypothetical protein VFJ16_24840 [Longimicrobium sp.]|nr:hypothetical protein [Longimicrobium sp.]
MEATTLSRGQVEANHARYESRDRAEARPTPSRNVAAVESVVAGEVFRYRGRLFWFRPAPAVAGMRHSQALERLQAAAAGDASVDVAAEVAVDSGLLRRHARPLSRFGWLPWWMRPDPFRDATAREMGELNALFFDARMRSSVQSPGAGRSAR